MRKNTCVVTLPGERNYALISPGRIVYGLNASEEELKELINEDESTLNRNKPKEKIRNMVSGVSLGLIPTFDCNLFCVYCYSRGGETKEVMPLEIGMSAIRNADASHRMKFLRLYLVGGGEPLLHIDLVKELVAYARELYQEVEVNVVTNGTFDGGVVRWLLANKVHVRVSYDGVMHSVQRPSVNGRSSSCVVENNIKRLISGGCSPIVQCIVTKAGINTLRSTVDLLHGLGVRTVKFEPALITDVSRVSGDIEPDPKMYAEALLDVIQYVADENLDLKIDTGFFSEPSDDYYCGMGISNRIVTPHGRVTSCVEVARPDDPHAEFVMVGEVGKAKLLIDSKKRKQLLTLHYKNQVGGCKSCNLRLICHGGCPMANIWRNGLPLRKSMFTCVVEKTLLPKLLLLIALNPKVAEVIVEEGSIDRF